MARLVAASALFFLASADAQVTASRIWPARDYTRLTLESKAAVNFQVFSVKDPERLVLDLETEMTPALAELDGKVVADDPYIKGMRAARNRPGVVRVVLDLKTEVKPQVLTLTPIAEYGHRLVLDIYPAVPVDPLAALIEETRKTDELRKERNEQPKVARLATIVIDAGHGGEDPGAVGRHGTREKNVTLAIARRLKGLVDGEPNMRALLTRDGDYFLELRERVRKARAVSADLMVSIHADSFVRSNARGSSVYALSDRRATSEAARLLAQSENASDLIGGASNAPKDDYVRGTIIDLWQTGTIDYSLRLGDFVLKRLGEVNPLHRARVEQASFAVLTAPNVPSILVETAFISNPQEESRLADERYQDRLARAILEGIRDYIAKHPPRRTSPLALN
ncbi:MAG TPA: N-acetylmuramoyl-L-alanine amidase [Burkholderiales bacterium]|nr:N-acetylmuramoyl-L-alanine amidase [Burkholderiales bacterium]